MSWPPLRNLASKSAKILVRKGWLPNHEDFDWFRKRFPFCVSQQPGEEPTFELWVWDADGSTDYRDCMAYLRSIGCQPMSGRHPRRSDPLGWKGYFYHVIKRRFSETDYGQCELLLFVLSYDIREICARDESSDDNAPLSLLADFDYGDPLEYEALKNIHTRFLEGQFPLLALSDIELVASTTGRQLLECSGLTGFSINRPLQMSGPNADKVKDAYWMIDIPLVLPSSAKTRWERPEGQIYTGCWEQDAELPQDGFYAFDRAAVQAAGSFDLALGEGFGPSRRMLGSHRWFEFCTANQIPCQWTPVQVVD